MLEGFSLKEAAALAETSEKTIRHELQRGITGTRPKRSGKGARLRLSESEVFYYYLVRSMPAVLSRADRRDLYRIVASKRNREGRWTATRNRLRLSGDVDLEIDLARPRKVLSDRLRAFERGLERIESRPDVLSGEPVFKGTRVPIRHIGALVRKGVPIADIRGDYPWLTESDIGFADLFARLRPGPGRPRKPIELRRAG